MTIFSILFAILIFSFLIFTHELGHFAAAKLFGVRVNEFSMFMGPVLWQKQKGETVYSLRLVPLGGFCAMEGEDGDSDDPRSFTAAVWWKRAIILLAGVTMNFITGFALFACFFAPDKQFILPVVSEVEQGCALAEGQGIQPGDTLYALDGERIYVNSDFSLLLSLSDAERHDLTVKRDGKLVELPNLLFERREFADADGTTSLRFGFSFSVEDAKFSNYIKYVWDNTINTVRMVRLSLKMLTNGQASVKDVTGPVGIVNQMSEVASQSGSVWYAFLNMLYFGGFISVNLAVMNLLPIPALDGGRVAGLVLTALIEAVTRRKLDPKYEGYVHAAGMILLLALMGLVMFKDIFTLIFK